MPTISSLEANLHLSPNGSTLPMRSSISSPHETQSINANATNIGKDNYLGSERLPFPSFQQIQSYVTFFFEDVNPCHPCVNESEFGHRSQRLRYGTPVARGDITFLALNYIVFACVDFLRASDAESPGQHFPGWKWYSIADRLVGKRKTSGQGDLCMIQYLVYEVSETFSIAIDAARGSTLPA